MSLVGKKFPSIAVDAISEMGDNLKINIVLILVRQIKFKIIITMSGIF